LFVSAVLSITVAGVEGDGGVGDIGDRGGVVVDGDGDKGGVAGINPFCICNGAGASTDITYQ
jgi:hypothetical protein